jgi:hypothetical protein
VNNWLEEQMFLKDNAIKRLGKLRREGEGAPKRRKTVKSRSKYHRMIILWCTKTDGPKEKFHIWNPHGSGH